MVGFKITCLHCGGDNITVYDGVVYDTDETYDGEIEGRYEFNGPSLFCIDCGNNQNVWTGESYISDDEFEVPGQLSLWGENNVQADYNCPQRP